MRWKRVERRNQKLWLWSRRIAAWMMGLSYRPQTGREWMLDWTKTTVLRQLAGGMMTTCPDHKVKQYICIQYSTGSNMAINGCMGQGGPVSSGMSLRTSAQ